jgi:hypothetical protein
VKRNSDSERIPRRAAWVEMDDSPFAATPDDRLPEKLLWHHQISMNGRVQFELNVARKVHPAFRQIRSLNTEFRGTTLVEPANPDGDVQIEAGRRSVARIHEPSSEQRSNTEREPYVTPNVGAELSQKAHPRGAQNQPNCGESFRFFGFLGCINDRLIFRRQDANLFHNVWVLWAVQFRSAKVHP